MAYPRNRDLQPPNHPEVGFGLDGDPGDGSDALADLVAQTAALLIARHSAVDENCGCFLTRRAGDGKGGNIAGLEAGQLLDRPFDVLRPVVTPVDDDHVLGAADDE